MICFEGKRRVLNEKEQARKELKMTEKERARKERKADYMRAWRKANPEYRKRATECKREYYATHPEYRKRQAGAARAWREEHPEYQENLFLSLANKHKDGYVSDENRGGENHHCWKGGVNRYPRYTEFRVNRLTVLNNEGWKCSECGGDSDRVHHIDFSKDNHAIDNLLPVCRSCHKKLHRNKECLEEVYA